MNHDLYTEGQRIRLTSFFLTPHTLGSILGGTTALTVVDVTGLAGADAVFLEGAGPAGGDLLTTIVSIAGNVLTLAAAASFTVNLARFGKRVNPSTVTFRVKRPPRTGGTTDVFTQAAPEVTNPVTGKWQLAYVPAVHGTYRWRAEGTGTAAGADEESFTVERSEIV